MGDAAAVRTSGILGCDPYRTLLYRPAVDWGRVFGKRYLPAATHQAGCRCCENCQCSFVYSDDTKLLPWGFPDAAYEFTKI